MAIALRPQTCDVTSPYVYYVPLQSICRPFLREWRRTSSCRRKRWDDREIRAATRGRTDGKSACCHGWCLDRLAAGLILSTNADEIKTRHIERVQACTRWHFVIALCCHSNATRAPLQIRPMTTDNWQLTTDFIRTPLQPWQCTNSGHPLPLPYVTSGSVQ